MWLLYTKLPRHKIPLRSSDPSVSPSHAPWLSRALADIRPSPFLWASAWMSLSMRAEPARGSICTVRLATGHWKHHKSSENSNFQSKGCAEKLGASSACFAFISDAFSSVFPGEKKKKKQIQNSAEGNYILGWSKCFVLSWNTLSSLRMQLGLVAESLTNSKLKSWNF